MVIMITEQTDREPRQRESQARPALSAQFFVGDWQVLPEFNRLQHRKDASVRQLEPRLVNLLCYLAANSDRVLSRDQLIQELWPRVVVNENSLTRAVSELRKQLNSVDATVTDYIETIPKRGYRLIPAVESEALEHGRNPKQVARFTGTMVSQNSQWKYGSAITAICLSLVISSWFALNTSSNLLEQGNAVLLSDKILEAKPDYYGGKLTLSTMDNETMVVESIATPVVSMDEKQYAFIQYDSAGSTIFLGGLDTAIEPVPVFFSKRHLFNLAWSPVGNNLLFAMKPSMRTAAVFSSISETAELLMLNLNTLETSRLIRDINPTETDSRSGLNLT